MVAAQLCNFCQILLGLKGKEPACNGKRCAMWGTEQEAIASCLHSRLVIFYLFLFFSLPFYIFSLFFTFPFLAVILFGMDTIPGWAKIFHVRSTLPPLRPSYE